MRDKSWTKEQIPVKSTIKLTNTRLAGSFSDIWHMRPCYKGPRTAKIFIMGVDQHMWGKDTYSAMTNDYCTIIQSYPAMALSVPLLSPSVHVPHCCTASRPHCLQTMVLYKISENLPALCDWQIYFSSFSGSFGVGEATVVVIIRFPWATTEIICDRIRQSGGRGVLTWVEKLIIIFIIQKEKLQECHPGSPSLEPQQSGHLLQIPVLPSLPSWP